MCHIVKMDKRHVLGPMEQMWVVCLLDALLPGWA